MEQVISGWFSERSSLWPGQAMSLEVNKVLFDEKSKFQSVMVLETYVLSFVKFPFEEHTMYNCTNIMCIKLAFSYKNKLSPAKRRDIVLDLSVCPSVRHALFF